MIVKNVEKKDNNQVTFQVESSAEEFEKAVNGAYLKNKSSIYIPGFRKGKAPRAVVEGMYGREAFYQEAMDDLAPEAFEFGAKEAELRMVGAPAIVNVEVTEAPAVIYTFGVTLYPEVTLGEYKGLSAEKDAVNVTDEDVDRELEAVRQRNARMVSVEDRPAQMGDTANIDFDGYLNGERFDGGKAEGYDLQLGSGSFVPGFEEQVVGMSIGEEKDLPITFPEQYVEELAGKDVIFKVKLNSLTFAELPEVDDEFAKDVSEFDTLDEYKADLRANVEKRMQEQADNKFSTEIMQLACDNMTVDIPAVMISDKVEEIVRNYAANFGLNSGNMPFDKLLETMGIDEETINGNIRPAAEFQVKTDLLLEAVMKAEDLNATEEEREEYLKKVAENLGTSPEELKSYFDEDFITRELMRDRASKIIIDSAVEKKPAKKRASKKTEKKAEEEAAAAEEQPAKKRAPRKTKKKAEEEAAAAEEQPKEAEEPKAE